MRPGTDMTRPVVNLDDIELKRHARKERFESSQASVAQRIGGRKLGSRLVRLPPGKKAWPFHNHHTNEEMYVILKGEGQLRFGSERMPVRARDVFVAPPGGQETAHQIINDSSEELEYLVISTMEEPDVTEYPDTGKFGVIAGSPPGGKPEGRTFTIFSHLSNVADYWEGEE